MQSVDYNPTFSAPQRYENKQLICLLFGNCMRSDKVVIRSGCNDFFKPTNERTNEFDFTTMIPQIDLFSFVFWKKSKTPKNISKLTDL